MAESNTLSIRRVPTMVSIYQEGVERPGCGRICLGSCCIPGAKLPVYIFSPKHLSKQEDSGDSSDDEGILFLDTLILAQWEERLTRGLFRYDVTACETKVLPGEFGFVAQLNEGRHLKKRPTEFRVDQVLQGFDAKKFNFTKVGQEEVLFCFEERMGLLHRGYCKEMVVGSSPNVVAINVSPIEYGHILLVPKLHDCKPQQIDIESFRLAVNFAAEAENPNFRVGYNSLGAFATINHLHFQAYYLAVPFAVERAAVSKLASSKKKGVKLCELANYAVKGFLYESSGSLLELADSVAKACIALQERNIPFNVLIADCGQRIFLFPQCFAEKQALGQVETDILDTQVNPAVWEISGHLVLKRRIDYESASEEYARKLLAEVSLSEEGFSHVKNMCIEILADEVEAPGYSLEQSEKLAAAQSGFLDCMPAAKGSLECVM